jgi:uncharacterized membrane protein
MVLKKKKTDLYGTTGAPTGQFNTPILTADPNNQGGSGIPRELRIDDSQKIADCRARGGRWDATNRTCVMPEEQAKPSVDLRTEGNKFFIGNKEVSEQEYRGAQDSLRPGVFSSPQQQGRLADMGIDPFASKQAETRQQQALLSQPQTMMTPDGREIIQPEGMLSRGATLASAGAGAVLGAKTTGALGATIGSFLAPGVGTVIGGAIGAGVGAVGGAIGGAFVKMKVQKIQDVREAKKVFSTAKTNKDEILNMVNAGLVTEGQARSLWNEENQRIYASYSFLKRQTQNDLNNFLGSPGDELIDVQSYLALDPQYNLEFEKALMQPNPMRIKAIMRDE